MNITRFKGCGCTIFCDISQKTYKSLNNMKDLNYYIVVGCSDDNIRNFSAPMLINKPINRTAFGIQCNEANVNMSIFFPFLFFINSQNFRSDFLCRFGESTQ